MGKIYHPTPRDPTIQAVVDPDAVFDPDGRKMKMAFFNPDGSVASVGGGTKGDTGDPGASAYDVWLANGNSGTVDDYLASLKGAKGDPGEQGPPGDPAIPRVGLLSNIGSAVTYGVGAQYFATDDHGGSLYISDGANWTIMSPRGLTLAQAIRTTDVTNQNNTAYADIPGMAITFTPRTIPFTVDCWLNNINVAGTVAAGGSFFVYTQLVNADASVVYLPESWTTLPGNLFGSGPRLFRRFFDVGDFTPGVAMTIKLQTKLAVISVSTPAYGLIRRMGIRAKEEV